MQVDMHTAREFAEAAHAGQLDKAGLPYSGHLGRVAAKVDRLAHERAGGTPEAIDEAIQIAWLHDTLEDTDTTPDDLRARGFSEPVVAAVLALSKPMRPTRYADWIRAIASYAPPAVVLVKLADVEDNSDPERLTLLPAAIRDRLRQKYAGAAEALRASLEAHAVADMVSRRATPFPKPAPVVRVNTPF